MHTLTHEYMKNEYTLLLHFSTRAYLFSPDEGSCIVFSTRNNCEVLAFYGVIFQSVINPFFKTPVFGAPLTSYACTISQTDMVRK